jgi:hypothetical protein
MVRKAGLCSAGEMRLMGVLLVIFGALTIAGGVFGKDFRASDIIALGEFKQRSSKWLGRLIFIMVGLGLVYVGIKMLLRTE